MRWDLDAVLRRMAQQIEENDALLARLAPADGDGGRQVWESDEEEEWLAAPSRYPSATHLFR